MQFLLLKRNWFLPAPFTSGAFFLFVLLPAMQKDEQITVRQFPTPPALRFAFFSVQGFLRKTLTG